MSTYTIVNTYPSNEDGYVYVDALVDDDTVTRRLILPEEPKAAQAKMDAYVSENTTAPDVPETSLDVLVDQTIEAKPIEDSPDEEI